MVKNLVDKNIVRIFANRKANYMKLENKYKPEEELIAKFGKALGHPARVAIMHYLAAQKTCFFGDIHDVLPISKATVSQHLSELKDAGLIQGEFQPPKVKYCINNENWALAKRLIYGFFEAYNPEEKGTCCG